MIDPISLTVYVVVGTAKGVAALSSAIAAGVSAHSTVTASGVALLSLGALYKTLLENNELRARIEKNNFHLNEYKIQNEKLKKEYEILLALANDKTQKISEILKKAEELEAKVRAFELSMQEKAEEIIKLNCEIEKIQTISEKNKNALGILINTVSVLLNENKKAHETSHNVRHFIADLQAKLPPQQAGGPKLFDAKAETNTEKIEPQAIGMMAHFMNKLRQRN